jgi:hypothetical protein
MDIQDKLKLSEAVVEEFVPVPQQSPHEAIADEMGKQARAFQLITKRCYATGTAA